MKVADIQQYGTLATELVDIGIQYGLSLLSAVAILVAGFVLAGWISRTLRRRLETIKRFDHTLIPILAQIARYAVLLFTLILVLAEFGIQTTSIIAVLGAAGLAIGLALQGTLQNVAAGMMLLFLRPFKAGDFIETSAASGTVSEIGMFMTRLNTAQGIHIAVPNSRIWSDSIINYSKNPRRRLDLLVGIAYEDDIDRARKIILELAHKEERILKDPEPVVIVKDLGESSVDLELRAWIKRADFWDVRFQMLRDVKYALDAAGISIPYPHRQVVMVKA
ncbi:MAG: mechanosensitive ion channel family protein [Alphaproteobacteria bacterium]|nr:MAG: mechanosensitive ion channel family protein [Alphaproteobacteria bacterium]